jgi:hypothetical protein
MRVSVLGPFSPASLSHFLCASRGHFARTWCGVAVRMALGAAVLTSVAPIALAAQQREPAKAPPKPITLTGCVQRGESAPGEYTLAEKKDSQIYRLTGTDLRDYVGRRVQIVGGVATNRLRIAGGLKPSPNAAAQAGAMDPARAAVAGAGGSAGPGKVELPEFRVKSVRPISGSCSN